MRRLKYLPFSDADKCTGCNIRRIPARYRLLPPKQVGKGLPLTVISAYSAFCCWELCPQGAFEIKASSWLGSFSHENYGGQGMGTGLKE